MKVLFVGYGSIARRHITNLSAICSEQSEGLTIDLLRHKPTDAPEGVRRSTDDIAKLEKHYDAVFVTNPTSKHYETLAMLLNYSDFFFVEKPVFDGVDYDIEPLLSCGKVFYTACPLRYTKVLQWVKRNVNFADVRGIRCICSSYLPDWRPGTDYRKTYSAHTNMGGGVHIDLIHEWDYICFLMGLPTEVHSIIGKYSDLEIDSPDTAIYIADIGGKTAEVHLDYHGRAPLRAMDIFCSEETISCDLLSGSVRLLREDALIDLSEIRDDFQRRELEHFLDIMAGKVASDNDLVFATKVLEVARGGRSNA